MEDRVQNKRAAVEEILDVVTKRGITINELGYILGKVKEIADTTVIVPTKELTYVAGETINI